MWELEGSIRHYAWGDDAVLPDFLGRPRDGRPWSEAWYGAHALGPASVVPLGIGLDAALAADPEALLGDTVTRTFGARLPYLLKVIAPARPLSLQVHPTREHAAESYAAENAAGIPLDAEHRTYRDDNHKPEMVVAIERLEALCGFRAPRRAAAILEGLGTPVTERLHRLLVERPDAHGMRAAFRSLVSPAMRPDPHAVRAVAAASAARLARGGSPSPRIDRIVATLQHHFPGDPGVIAALLLNPVTLHPGEALFIPSGVIHAYLSGFAVEIMAASDNVLRAGLTPKRVDADEMLHCVSMLAAPPMRLAPERITASSRFYYAPTDEFELSITQVADVHDAAPDGAAVPGGGPRIVLGLDGEVQLETGTGHRALRRGQALFVPASAGALRARGNGRMVQAGVP